MSSSVPSSNHELVSTRLIKASPAEVYEAISDPAHLAKWWGPAGFRNTFHEFKFEPGGIWRFDMHGPDGASYANKCVFEQVTPQLIVFQHLEPVHQFRLSIALAEEDGGTRLTWRQAFETAAECDRVRSFAPRCNEENLDRLEAELATMSSLLNHQVLS